jgi:hypothetical protein
MVKQTSSMNPGASVRPHVDMLFPFFRATPVKLETAHCFLNKLPTLLQITPLVEPPRGGGRLAIAAVDQVADLECAERAFGSFEEAY